MRQQPQKAVELGVLSLAKCYAVTYVEIDCTSL